MSSLVLALFVVTWLAIFASGFLLLGMLRNQSVLSWRLDQLALTTPSKVNRNGLKPGAKAPGFVLPDTKGELVALEDFTGRKVLLAFTQSGCGPCHTIMPELEALHRKGRYQVVVVNGGVLASTHDWGKKLSVTFPILIQEGFEVSKKYEAYATPFAFVIDECGVVISRGLVTTARQLGFVLSAENWDGSVREQVVESSPGRREAQPA